MADPKILRFPQKSHPKKDRTPHRLPHKPLHPWTVFAPQHSFKDLIVGVPGFRFSPDEDLMLLLDTFQYQFLATRHYVALGYFASQTQTRRLIQLLHQGLLARQRHPVWRQSAPNQSEYVYSITAFGYECLVEWDDTLRRMTQPFKPYYESTSRRNTPAHDTGVADLVLALRQQLPADCHVTWHGAYKARQLLHSGGRSLVSPDALLIITSPSAQDLVLVEYEQSIRPSSVEDKLLGYQAYFQKQPWSKNGARLTARPKVLVSAGHTADLQRYWASPFQAFRLAAQFSPFLYDRLFLIGEEDWRQGQWPVVSIRPGLDAPLSPVQALLTPPLQ